MLAQRKNRLRLLPFVLLLLLFCGCASRPSLTQEEIPQLREEYPYCDYMASSALGNVPELTWAFDNNVLAIVEITGEKRQTLQTAYPNPEFDPNLSTTITTYYFPAKILNIVDTREGFSLDAQEVVLSFPGALYNSNAALNPGDRLILFATIIESSESDPVELGIGPLMNFYVTKDEYVLSLSDDPTMDQFSGLPLETFIQKMKTVTERSGWREAESWNEKYGDFIERHGYA